MKQLTCTDEVCTATGTIPAFGEAARTMIKISKTISGRNHGTNYSAESAKIFQEKFRYEENFIS